MKLLASKLFKIVHKLLTRTANQMVYRAKNHLTVLTRATH